MMSVQDFINRNGIMFKIERNNTIIEELKGLPNHEKSTSKKYVGFMPDSNVQVGDWIINPSNERLFVSDTTTAFFHGEKSQLKAYYQTLAEHNSEEKSTNVFNIGTANNSVIGTQSVVTMNINNSIQKAREQIDSSNSEDKNELHQIINLLECISKDQTPLQQGLLSRFSGVIQKNSWISSPITSIILNLLLTQIH